MIIEAFFIDFLDIDESFKPNINVLALEDTLLIGEAFESNFQLLAIDDTLVFTETLSLNKILNLGINDSLLPVESYLPRVTLLSLTDSLIFIDELALDTSLRNKDSLNFNESWIVSVSTPLSDILTLTDILEYTQVRGKGYSDTLSLQDAYSGVLAHCPCPTVPEQPRTVTLAYGSDAVVLPMPKFGNSNTLLFKRISRVSRGNDLIVAGVPSWNPSRLQRFEWDYLSRNEADSIFNFMKKYHGIPITVTGVYADVKTVILLKPDAELSQIGINNSTIILDMQEVQ